MQARADKADVIASDLVPFIGAGVSSSVRLRNREQAFPTWTQLLSLAAERLPAVQRAECLQLVDDGDFVEAARTITDSLSKPAWHRLLKKTFDRPYRDIDPETLWVQKLAWRCSNGLVVTTNYDRTLVWTVPDDIRDDLSVIGLDQPLMLGTLATSDTARPILWHLHGRIEFPGTLVISPAGYAKLYGSDDETVVDHRFAQAIFCLRHIIATRSLLFIGFSLADARVVGELQTIFRLFDDSENSHFIIAHTSQIPVIEKRISDAGLSNIEILEIQNYDDSMQSVLEEIANGREHLVVSSRVRNMSPPSTALRRRCRTIVVGSDGFRERVLPCIAENRQHDAYSRLIDELTRDSSAAERVIAATVAHEIQGDFDRMLAASNPGDYDGEEEWNISLFHAIALEKLGRTDEALASNIAISEGAASAELRLCADFNAMVCRNKQKSVETDFSTWINDQRVLVGGVERLWVKAFNMQLISCIDLNTEFEFSHLLDEALAAEVGVASTGFGKTLLNWAAYSGHKLDSVSSAEVWRVAGHSSVTARLAMLDNLRAFTTDPTLVDAIDRVLVDNHRHSSVKWGSAS